MTAVAINHALQVKLWDLQTRTCAQVGAGPACSRMHMLKALTCLVTHTPALRTCCCPTTFPRNPPPAPADGQRAQRPGVGRSLPAGRRPPCLRFG